MTPGARDVDPGSRARDAGARVPPAGAPAPDDQKSDLKITKNKPQKAISADQKKSKVDHFADHNNDGLGNLRKLLKEGKIAGLNDKPPAFTPPSPPSKTSVNKSNKKQKAPSPRAADKSIVNATKSKTEKRLAPPPPPELKPPPPSALVQFLGGRRVHSVENIAEEAGEVSRRSGGGQGEVSSHPGPGSEQLKRSTSMHGPGARNGKPYHLFPGARSQHILTLHFSEYLGKSQPRDSVAQLIADSTEKKFRFNSLFKGIWKKKQAQYSLDM